MARRTRPSGVDAGPPLSPLPPSPKPLRGGWRWALPILLLLYVTLAIAHASLAPLGGTGYQNAPDETAHITYVRVVAHLRLPSNTNPGLEGTRSPSYEWHQPPLYYWLDAALLPFGARAMRGLSLLCGIASLLFIFFSARKLFPEDPMIAVLAVGLAGLTPGHIAITSTVNNDALLEACMSGVLYLLIVSFLGGFTIVRAAMLGFAIGLAVLAKATGLLLLPVLLLALFFLWREGEDPLSLFRGALWSGGVCLLTCGWWLARNIHLYGELLPVHTFTATFSHTAQAADFVAALGGWGNYSWNVLINIFKSFWAVYSTSGEAVYGIPRYLPDQFYLLTGLASGLALAGLIRLHFRRKATFTPVQQHLVLLLFGSALIVSAAFAVFLSQYYQTQGRYLYPVMLPISILFALGWRAAFPERYANLATLFFLGMLGLCALAFLGYIASVSGSSPSHSTALCFPPSGAASGIHSPVLPAEDT